MVTHVEHEGLEKLDRAHTAFGTVDTGDRTNIYEIKSIYGLSIRDVQTTEGSGSIGHNGPAFTLSTTANGPDRALLESAEIGRYVPGLVAEPGVYFQTDDSSLSGSQVQRWGYFDDQDGLYFGRDADGLFVELRSGGSTVRQVRQEDWNLDTLDGSGDADNPSGKTLDVTEGHIYRAPFIWYGSGPAIFEVVLQGESSDHTGIETRSVRVHEIARTDGSRLMENPNLPVSVELDNDGTAAAMSAEVSGRQFSLKGNYSPNVRVTSETVTGVGVGTSGFTNLLTFRRKQNVTDGAFFEAASVKLGGLDIITDQDLQVLVVTNPSLTSANFGSLSNVSDPETALEVDTAASVSGGESIWEQVQSGGAGNKTQFASTDTVNFDFVRRQPVSILASAIDSSATVDATCRLREEW